MIVSLTIKNIVLIDRLQIDFEGGLCVLSGETGAGKSILLSGIGLVIGARSEKELIRHGCDQGTVSAEISVRDDHKVWKIFYEQGLEFDRGPVILRRTIMRDGRSRAFINDQSVTIALLRKVGRSLIEIHGQHDERGLLNPSGHRNLLDNFGSYDPLLSKVNSTYSTLVSLKEELIREQVKLELAQSDEDYIRHNLEELKTLDPKLGEEEKLAKERSRMMQGETLSTGLKALLGKLLSDKGVDTVLRTTLRKIERMSAKAPGLLEGVSNSLEQAANETSEGIQELEGIIQDLEYNPYDLENNEERLFAIRAAARKHNCQPDQLIALMVDFNKKLDVLKFSDDEVHRLTNEVKAVQVVFESNVQKLSADRYKTAIDLDKQVNKELPSLKMDKAKFKTFIEPLEPVKWNGEGGERVDFRVSTNPGAPFGGLIKIASGGELSRFILALKVVLARKGSVATLIFDEIDQGVGGAVANAVGERLSQLADKAQILVITHSPQVAARGRTHWLINKSQTGEEMLKTSVTKLIEECRREEIARMISGAEVTKESRAAADNLLQW